MTYKLKHDHPFYKKVEELMRYAETLGVSINFYGHKTVISDEENEKYYDLKDNDNGENLSYFPSFTEFKLTFEE